MLVCVALLMLHGRNFYCTLDIATLSLYSQQPLKFIEHFQKKLSQKFCIGFVRLFSSTLPCFILLPCMWQYPQRLCTKWITYFLNKLRLELEKKLVKVFFSKHHKTVAVIPYCFIAKLRKSNEAFDGLFCNYC